MWETVGQERAVALLRRGLEAGRVAHAYLFTGPAHSGKMTLALDLARAVNCEADSPPCGECDSCRRITAGIHADVQVIELDGRGDPDSESRVKISVQQIEDVQHAASLPPFQGRCKVFIFDGAESLSLGAANRLLKTLEEPEARAHFVLLTGDEGALPETIVSRCQRVELVPMPVPGIEAALKDRWGAEPAQARLAARLAGGRLGWAVRFVSDEAMPRQRNERLDALARAIAAGVEGRFQYAAGLAERFRQDRPEVMAVLELWLGWWRDVLLVKTGGESLVANVDRVRELAALAERLSVPQIRAAIDAVLAARQHLALNANPRLVLEVLMLNIPGLRGVLHPA